MKLHKVREEINKSSCTFLDCKFDLNDTWFDTNTFSAPIGLQPINRILVIKINQELYNDKSISEI